jgi:hypothetical protein
VALQQFALQEMINNRNRSVVRDMKWSLGLRIGQTAAFCNISLLARALPCRSMIFSEKISCKVTPKYKWVRIASLFVRGADCQKPFGCIDCVRDEKTV